MSWKMRQHAISVACPGLHGCGSPWAGEDQRRQRCGRRGERIHPADRADQPTANTYDLPTEDSSSYTHGRPAEDSTFTSLRPSSPVA